uniref:Carbohydrate kinase PfkB domain-containing protein n=1 Tax=Chlamydomonas euryale TaxID=1486919 RepID=A0A7R9VJX3_9CHLO|mmetsp:Transcript_37505/g.110779  ORF Transcript_37505/g.110779 Transcript_37505/m.110779 type:complete len:446 (+) Transcript_37505:929-2266(+)
MHHRTPFAQCVRHRHLDHQQHTLPPPARAHCVATAGAQSLFAFQLVNGQRTRVGLAAGVGPDLPSSCQAWLESIGVDLSGLVRYKRPTPRAWQVFEADGRRTQIYRVAGDPCDSLYEMLRPKFDVLPRRFREARNYHIGVHPLHPPLRALAAMRAAAHAAGGVLSVEPYTAAEVRPSEEQLAQLLGCCDIFSPNELEAKSLLGPGPPEQLLQRLFEAAGDDGAHTIVLRRGEHGVLAACRARSSADGGVGVGPAGVQQPRKENEAGLLGAVDASRAQEIQPSATSFPLPVLHAWRVPAVADTKVADVTGCGNAFCGAFLAAYDRFRRLPASGELLEAALWGCVAAAFMAEAEGVPTARVLDLQVPALRRVEALRPRAEKVELQLPPPRPRPGQGPGGDRAVVRVHARMRAAAAAGATAAATVTSGRLGRVRCTRSMPSVRGLAPA